jgi:hypothetical protein
MCGIGGFSLSADSKINPRKLSNALLTALEDRGYMASGFAYQTVDSQGYHKAAVAGSQLSLKRMPKNARTAIVHTRLATHGSIDDNRNNHPVMSPSHSIALVHNGVIYNHRQVRAALEPHFLPEVDTSVIPALIEQASGTARLNELDGDAAIAWLDDRDIGTLNLARVSYSPLTIAHLEDGTFVFASTEDLLWRVLIQLNLTPVWMENAPQLTHYVIRKGVICAVESLPQPLYDDDYDTGYYRHQTAGAKGSYKKSYTSDYQTGGWGYNSYGGDWWDDESDDDNTAWDKFYAHERQMEQDEDPADAYYIQYKSSWSKHAAYHYYQPDEFEAYKMDVYLFTNEGGDDYTIVDYGHIEQGGLLVSALPAPQELTLDLDPTPLGF